MLAMEGQLNGGVLVAQAEDGDQTEGQACKHEQNDNGAEIGTTAVDANGEEVSPPAPVRGWDALQKRRNEKKLIARMLDLDEPVMTEKMILFLLSDGACESLISFITQIPEEDEVRKSPRKGCEGTFKRPEPGDDVSEELKLSFRATMLLASNTPSEAHSAFLAKKARDIAAAVFKIFWPSAKGSLHHACCVLDYLLRSYADEVFETIGRGLESLERHLGPMLSWAEFAPVSETMVKLLTFPSVSGAPSYKTSAPSKWRLYSALAEWRFLLRVAENIFDRESSDSYASACADLLLEVVDRLSTDDNGELLLQPIGHCKELVDGLAAMAVDPGLALERRTDSARTLLGITQKAANPSIVFVNALTSIYDSQPATTVVPNRLSSVRELLHEQLQAWLPKFCAAVCKCDNPVPGESGAGDAEAVAHPGYEVKRPFTMLRYVLVGLIVEIIERDPKQLGALPVELWKVLCSWFFRYPHNNLYHAVFYKLVFKALRCNNGDALRNAVSKGRLVAQLVDSQVDSDKSASNRGYVLQLCNAIRLQADTMPPTEFLRTYLNSHEQWRHFLGALREATLKQQQPGLGFKVPVVPNFSGPEPLGMQEKASGLPEDVGIDHGSAYARALGFEGEIVWLPEEGTGSHKPKKKKKKKKKKKNGSAVGVQPAAEETLDHTGEDGDVAEDEDDVCSLKDVKIVDGDGGSAVQPDV